MYVAARNNDANELCYISNDSIERIVLSTSSQEQRQDWTVARSVSCRFQSIPSCECFLFRHCRFPSLTVNQRSDIYNEYIYILIAHYDVVPAIELSPFFSRAINWGSLEELVGCRYSHEIRTREA